MHSEREIFVVSCHVPRSPTFDVLFVARQKLADSLEETNLKLSWVLWSFCSLHLVCTSDDRGHASTIDVVTMMLRGVVEIEVVLTLVTVIDTLYGRKLSYCAKLN